jgi:MGT family glycosyltransferase
LVEQEVHPDMTDARTLVFFPEPGAWGPTNNCVAIGEVLRERGHRVVFVVDSSFEGLLEAKGFEERGMRMAPPEESTDPDADPWSEFIRVTAPEFRKPTIEQQATVTRPIWEALVAGVSYSHDRLMEIWEDVRPDVVCTDNVTGFPAVELAGCPWARFVSANPLEMRDRQLPPPLSGLPTADPSQWQAFREEYRRVHEDLFEQLNGFRTSAGVAPCPPDEFNTHSPWLNLYLFPQVADYPRSVPLDPTWHRLQSTVRTSEEPFDVDAQVPGVGKVVYLSLGSLGCMDVELMQRLIDALATTGHRVVVSMGPLKDQMKLGPRMYGDQFLPQPSILPQCDLLITHGGNNTTCEGFHFGLPMIGLPLFWDQYDNAQRLQETGFGRRLPTYDWTGEQLVGSVNELLSDEDLAARMRARATMIQEDPGRVKAADLLERLALTREPLIE